MKSIKKLLALAVILTLVLGLMPVAFGATLTEGVTNSDVKEAVEKLAALGIVNGMEDGKYHPELDVTREQFAKLLVVSLGLDGSAKASAGTTKFKDVEANRWSSGYINVATSKGLIKGFPDGTFKPADKVTYAQAITMIVRALGYKDEWLEGVWPSNMINKADEIGLLDGVDIAEGPANRGDVALLLNNALTIDMVVQTGFGTEATYSIQEGTTILSSKLKVTEIEDAIVTKVPKVDSSLDSNEITVKYGSTTKTYELKDGIDANALFGLETTLWVKDSKVIYADVTTDENDVIYGTVTDDGGITIQFANGDDEDYTLASGATIYVNNASDSISEGYFGKFVLNDDDEIRFADVYDWDYDALLVSEVNATSKYIKYYTTSGTGKYSFSAKDGYKVFGAVNKLEDIKKNDVVYVAEVTDNGDDYTYIYVVRNVVNGTLTRTNTDASQIKIGSKTYDVGTATSSLDNNKTVKTFTKSNITDAIGENVVVYLDIKGEVRHLVADIDTSSDVIYGIVLKTFVNNSGDDAAKIYLPTKDASVTYVYDDENIIQGSVVVFTVDEDGVVDDAVYVYKNGTPYPGSLAINADLKAQHITVTSFNDDYDYIAYSDGKLYIDEDTLIVNGTDLSDPELVKWDDIKSKDASGAEAIVVKDGDVAKYIVFVNNYDLTSDYSLAVVTDRFFDGDEKATFKVCGGSTVTLELDDEGLVDEGDIVVFSTNTDNVVTTVDKAVYNNVYATSELAGGYQVKAGTVTSFSKNIIKLNSGETYKLTTDVEVYVLTLDDNNKYDSIEEGSLGDISEDDVVRIIVNDDDEPVMLIIVE